MRTFAQVIAALGFAMAFAATPVSAQERLHVSDFFDQHPQLTTDQFEEFTAQLGSVLRFRQLSDATTLGKGNIDVSVQFTNSPIAAPKAAWSGPTADRYLERSISLPQVVARFGVKDRVDLGVWGGVDGYARYGLVGVDTKVALLRQGPTVPVSVSVRPSATFLVGSSALWAGTVGADVTVSRAFGAASPYAGLAASSSGAIARPKTVALDAVSAGESLAYAGLSYRLGFLVLSGEAQKAGQVSYAFRVGTRF